LLHDSGRTRTIREAVHADNAGQADVLDISIYAGQECCHRHGSPSDRRIGERQQREGVRNPRLTARGRGDALDADQYQVIDVTPMPTLKLSKIEQMLESRRVQRIGSL
jgi:hypothetical protein